MAWFGDPNTDLILEQLAALRYDVRVLSARISRLTQQENTIMIDVTALTASVAEQTTVNAGIIKFCDNVTAALAAIAPSTDPATQASLDALRATIDANNAAIAADVLKNTAAAPPAA